MSKPTHDVCIAEDYTAADGEEKAYFTNVGSAWLKDSGTMSVELRAGLALSGRFVIMPKVSLQPTAGVTLPSESGDFDKHG